MKQPMKLTSLERYWIFYDVANSAFTMIAASLLPIWFKDIAITGKAGGLTSDQATATWALFVSLVTIVAALLGPVLGAIADQRGRKKILFSTMLAFGVLGCFFSGFTSEWMLFLTLFTIAKIAYSGSLMLYDSMLVDVTTPERMDVVSSFGYAWGYIGSCIPFLVALAAYVMDMMLHWISPEAARMIGCAATALWWFGVTIPLLRDYRQTHGVEHRTHAIRDSFVQVVRTVQRIVRSDKKVLFFLLAFFMYIDGVGTIIDNAINVGTDLGLDPIGQVIVLLATQVVAFAFSLWFARLSRKYSTYHLLVVCIVGYFAVCLYAMTLQTLWQFGIMAFGVGMFQGSIQAFSRSYFGRIIPPEHAGEYFGIYDIFSKGASFLGSFVIALVKYQGGSINVALGSLAIFFLLGLLLLRKAEHIPAQRSNVE